MGTHKPIGWLNKNMKKLTFWRKTHLKKMIFFLQKSDPLAIVVAWVPIMGVYNQVLGAFRLIKNKNGKILPFSNLVFLP